MTATIDLPAAQSMTREQAIGTLVQIGWFNEHTHFMALNLRHDQLQIVNDASLRFPGVPIEELVTRALWEMTTKGEEA